MIKKDKRFLVILLVLALVLTSVSINYRENVADTQAASKKIEISDKKVSIGLGAQGVEQVLISNKKESAVYTYKSSDTSIVKVDSQDILTGVKYGTAKITVREKYNGKTSVVGQYEVEVKKTTIKDVAKADDFLWAEIGKATFEDNPFNLQDYVEDKLFDNRNMDASYTFYSGDTSILKIKSNGLVEETLKAGKVRITIKETYKKKTRTLGDIGMEIKEPEFTKAGRTLNIVKYSSLDMNKYLNYLTYQRGLGLECPHTHLAGVARCRSTQRQHISGIVDVDIDLIVS